MGRIERLWLKPAHRLPMSAKDELKLVEEHGIVENADAGRATRQVTVISQERWQEAQRALGADVDPASRRANVMVSGIDLDGSRGRVLRLGEVRIEIVGETRPCTRMDDAHPGLQDALDARWGGGAYGKVLTGGVVRVGDPAALEG